MNVSRPHVTMAEPAWTKSMDINVSVRLDTLDQHVTLVSLISVAQSIQCVYWFGCKVLLFAYVDGTVIYVSKCHPTINDNMYKLM